MEITLIIKNVETINNSIDILYKPVIVFKKYPKYIDANLYYYKIYTTTVKEKIHGLI